MTRLAGKEPKHWHDAEGRHRMPDPRRLAAPQPIEGTNEMSAGMSKATICHGDPDMAAYWDHLDAHDRERDAPEPRDDDPEQIRALFASIEANEKANRTMRELITALRQQNA